MMKEKYMSKLSRTEASTTLKLCTRMINLKAISEISINTISYAHDAEKNKMWQSIYWKVQKTKELIHKTQYTGI